MLIRTLFPLCRSVCDSFNKSWLHFVMLTVRGYYHAGDEGQRTGVLPAGKERVTFGKIPAHGHISGDVLSGVDREIGGAHSMHSGLKNYERRHHQ